MHCGKCLGDAVPAFLCLGQIPSGEFREENVQQIHLGDSGRNGAALEGIFVGTALQHHVRILRPGGIGEARDENDLCPRLAETGFEYDGKYNKFW